MIQAVQSMLEASMRIRSGDIALVSCVKCHNVTMAASLDNHDCPSEWFAPRGVTLAQIIEEYERTK